MRSLRREPALLLALLAVIALVLAFIVYPQLQVVLTPGPGGYVEFLQEGTWLVPLRNSLQLTLLSTATAVLLGFIYAYAMVYSNMRWKPFFRLIGILPLLSPPFVVAAAYTLLFGARGVISYGVFGQSPNIYGLNGVWGVQTIAFFPFAYQLIADALSRSDPRMEQAARNLGAGSWRVFWSVTLPLSRPGLGAAILTTAIYILEDFGNPQLIGGVFYVLPTQAYSLISSFGEYTSAAAVSTILLLLALGLYLATVSPGVSRACFVACLGLAGVILLVYGSLVVSALTLRFPNNLQFTTEHFQYVLSGTNGDALRNTLIFSGVAAAVSAVFALFAGWLVQRGQWPGRRALDLLLILPAAIPGIFFGLGYLVAFNQKWLDFVDRGWLIIIAFIFWNIPVGYQAAVAGLRQIDRSIDEAATSLGASSLRGFREVVLPMLGGSLRVGFITTFVRAVTTLSLVIFLFTPPTTVATIRIYQLVGDLNWGAATAYTVSDIGMAIIALLIFAVLARGRIALGAARA